MLPKPPELWAGLTPPEPEVTLETEIRAKMAESSLVTWLTYYVVNGGGPDEVFNPARSGAGPSFR
jgi:hypothetical protein